MPYPADERTVIAYSWGETMAKVISVLSGKGGTGKSTIAASLALSLADAGASVLAADMDIGLRSLDLLLGMENRLIYDLGDALAGTCPVRDALAVHPRYSGLSLLCAPADLSKSFQVPETTALLHSVSGRFDYLILDLPAGVGLSVLLARELSDLNAVVTVPDLVTLRDSRKVADLMFTGSRKPCRLIVNKVSRETVQASGIRDLDEVMDMVGLPLLGVLPADPFINSYSADVTRGKRRSELTQKIFDAMAQRIRGEYVPLLLQSL